MRLVVDVDWQGDMDHQAYEDLVDDIADALIQVHGYTYDERWDVTRVGIQPTRTVRKRG